MIRAWVLLCALVVASSALAQEDYKRSTVDGKPNVCLWWQNRNFVYLINTAGSTQTPRETEFSAIDASFATWQTLASTCNEFTFKNGGRTEKAAIGYVKKATNENLVVFRERLCDGLVPRGDPCADDPRTSHALCGDKYQCWYFDNSHSDFTYAATLTTYLPSTGQIVDADIEINAAPHKNGDPGWLFTTVNFPACTTSPRPDCIAVDLQNTVTHEIGHAVGFDHVTNRLSTMYREADPLGETRKRVLDYGTALGFCDVYPKGLPSPPCDDLGTNRNGESIDKKIVGVGAGSGCGAAGSSGNGGLGALALVAALLTAWRGSRRRV